MRALTVDAIWIKPSSNKYFLPNALRLLRNQIICQEYCTVVCVLCEYVDVQKPIKNSFHLKNISCSLTTTLSVLTTVSLPREVLRVKLSL